VALHSAGHGPEAIAHLKEGLKEHPANRDIIMAIISFSREAGDIDTALRYAEQASRAAPDDPTIKSATDELRRQTSPR
jgi:DNA-binding SARP family transcriptional activator